MQCVKYQGLSHDSAVLRPPVRKPSMPRPLPTISHARTMHYDPYFRDDGLKSAAEVERKKSKAAPSELDQSAHSNSQGKASIRTCGSHSVSVSAGMICRKMQLASKTEVASSME